MRPFKNLLYIYGCTLSQRIHRLEMIFESQYETENSPYSHMKNKEKDKVQN